jgi:hypothetical protein
MIDHTDASHVDAAGDWGKDEAALAEILSGHPTSCSIPSITRVWINRPNVARPREQQGQHPIFDILLPDGRQLLVWGVQWAGLTHMVHKLDHPIMARRAVAWIETSAPVFVQLTKDGAFERADGV